MLTLVLLAMAVAPPAFGQAVESLLVQLSVESELLEEAFDRYQLARTDERDALTQLADLSERMDRLLENESAPATELRRLEGSLVSAGEIAAVRIRSTALARLEVFDRRERLVALERRLAEIGGGPLIPDAGISGLWQVEIAPEGAFGLMRIQADGTLVTGTYVLSNGDQGSVRGTVVGRTVELERIDSSLGFIATLEGELDPNQGRIDGSWTATAVSAGQPTTGGWTGRRLARGLSVRPRG